MKTTLLALTIAAFVAAPLAKTVAAPQSEKTTTTANPASDEWKTYKKDQEQKIANNDKMIAELRKRKASDATGKIQDAEFQKRIDGLEHKNNEMRKRLATFQWDNSKFGQFKREYNHDMEALSNDFKNIGKDKDNTK